MPPPKPTEQSKSVMKTRSVSQDTPSKMPSGSGSPAVGTADKSKQLKLVQEPDGAVGTAPLALQPVQPIDGDGSIRALLEKMDTKLENKFKQLEDKFTGMFDNLQEEIKGLREEVTESKTKFIELDTKVTEIEKSIEFNSKTCEDKAVAQTDSLNKVKAELEGKVQELENKLLLQEKQDRKYNLLFYGITEEPNEDIEDKLKNIFLKDLKLDYGRVSNMYFAHGHRIPTKSPGPKPIILRFAQYSDRDLMLSNAYKLAGSKRRIIADWPVQMKNERGRLSKIAYRIRKNELLQTRIKDKGLDVYLEVRKDETVKWVKREV